MNAYFICVIVCVQMWFGYAQLLDDQTQFFFFLVFHVFLEVISVTLVLKSFSRNVNFMCWKTQFLAFSQVAPSHEILKKF